MLQSIHFFIVNIYISASRMACVADVIPIPPHDVPLTKLMPSRILPDRH